MTPPIQLRSDLNAGDDNGENWALVGSAGDPSEVRVGALMVAGTPGFWAGRSRTGTVTSSIRVR